MLERIKALFGDAESMTAEELAAAIEKDGKIVDLKSGEFVRKAKLDEMTAKRDEVAAALKEAEEKGGDPEGLKAKITDLEGKLSNEVKLREQAESGKAKIERERAVEGKVADKRFTRFVVSEVEALVDENTTFDEALEKWLDENPDYAPKATDDDDDAGTPPVKLGTGKEPKGKPGKADPLIGAIDKAFGDTAEDGDDK